MVLFCLASPSEKANEVLISLVKGEKVTFQGVGASTSLLRVERVLLQERQTLENQKAQSSQLQIKQKPLTV